MSPIHASVIFIFPEFAELSESSTLFRKNSIRSRPNWYILREGSYEKVDLNNQWSNDVTKDGLMMAPPPLLSCLLCPIPK